MEAEESYRKEMGARGMRSRKWEQARIPPGQGFSVCRFVGLWVCGFVGLWGCGVVGLWCVCVCFIGRVGPKKLQKSV